MKPTPEQAQAIREWAAQTGRTWKSALREAWMTGDYGAFEKSNLLQQLRNQFGPTWLTRFSLKSINA
jgi:hypothetical protein